MSIKSACIEEKCDTRVLETVLTCFGTKNKLFFCVFLACFTLVLVLVGVSFARACSMNFKSKLRKKTQKVFHFNSKNQNCSTASDDPEALGPSEVSPAKC